MEFRSLQEKLADILTVTTLSEGEKAVLTLLYFEPGIELGELKAQLLGDQSGADKIIASLEKLEMVIVRELEGRERVYPVPLAILMKKCSQRETPEHQIAELDLWIKYPLLRSSKARFKTADKDTLITWLFDLHAAEWERVYCFGDYDSFIKTIGCDTEADWIKERIKKSRTASVVSTKDGEWARHIQNNSKEQLRDCLIDPKDFSDLFIMAFPDIKTTVMANSEGVISFVHSPSIANKYSNLVSNVITQK